MINFAFLKKYLGFGVAPPRSPNFGERSGVPSIIVLHYTGMQTAQAAIERLCDPAAQVSAHYVVEENGRIHNLVPEEKRAWHAGQSFWRGRDDINSHSIGIEIVNPGHEFGYRPFPAAQTAAVAALCQSIMTRWGIEPGAVLGHSDIAPARKQDPGELFPWAKLAERGVGLWPAPAQMDYQAAQDILPDDARVAGLLHQYGYDPALPLPVLLGAYHRHFYPEKFAPGADPARADARSVAGLLALLRQRAESTNL